MVEQVAKALLVRPIESAGSESDRAREPLVLLTRPVLVYETSCYIEDWRAHCAPFQYLPAAILRPTAIARSKRSREANVWDGINQLRTRWKFPRFGSRSMSTESDRISPTRLATREAAVASSAVPLRFQRCRQGRIRSSWRRCPAAAGRKAPGRRLFGSMSLRPELGLRPEPGRNRVLRNRRQRRRGKPANRL